MLELVDLWVADEEIEHPVNRHRCKLSIAVGTGHYTNKGCLVAGDECRDTESSMFLDRELMLGANCLERPPTLDLGKHEVSVDTDAGERIADNLLVAKVVSIVVANCEK